MDELHISHMFCTLWYLQEVFLPVYYIVKKSIFSFIRQKLQGKPRHPGYRLINELKHDQFFEVFQKSLIISGH